MNYKWIGTGYTVSKQLVELRFAREKQNGGTTLVPPFIKSPNLNSSE